MGQFKHTLELILSETRVLASDQLCKVVYYTILYSLSKWYRKPDIVFN